MIKKFLLVVIATIMVMACAAIPMKNEVVRHKLDLNVSSTEPVTIAEECNCEENQYEKEVSPYLKPTGFLSILYDKSEAFWYLNYGISTTDYKNFTNDLLYLEKETAIRTLTIFINSPGGDAFSGRGFADQIKRYQKKGFAIKAYGSSIIASAAIPIFAVCSPRIVSNGTMFMVHEAALFKWPGRESASDIASQHELMKLLENKYLDYLPTNVISRERWLELIKMATWFTAKEAKEWGLVDIIE